MQRTGLAVILLDLDGRVIDWSQEATAMTGFQATEVQGEHVSFLRTSGDAGATLTREELDQALAYGRYEAEAQRVRRDGSSFRAHVLLYPFQLPGLGHAGYVKVLRDLTREREMQNAVASREASLAASLAEREVLLQEVHHRVKNNLQVIVSLINMQIRACEDLGSQRALKECSSRVQTMALIHEKLYQSSDFSRIPFYEYVRSLSSTVFRTAGISPGRVSLTLSVQQILLRVDRAIPCGLLLNELLSNALKHGFPNDRAGFVEIVLRQDGNRMTLGVLNDGAPLPPNFDIESKSSLGVQLVSTLAAQLDGQLRVESEPVIGFWVDFPIEPTP